MKIVFFGTPYFAASILDYLLKHDVAVVAVVTQPDKKERSRKDKLTVKKYIKGCLKDIPLYQPVKASDERFVEELNKYDADLFVIAAFGQLLKQNLLDVPKLDCINVHTSLLPKYRGASPIQHALLNGDKKTGVTIMKVILKMDAGDIIDQAVVDITDDMNKQELEEELIKKSGPLLLKVIDQYKKGSVDTVPQDDTLVTFAPKLKPETFKIDWNKDAKDIHNLIRALAPFPSAYTDIVFENGEKKQLKIVKSEVVDMHGQIGEVVQRTKKSLIVGCGSNSLSLLKVQIEGKKEVDIVSFLNGIKSSFKLT